MTRLLLCLDASSPVLALGLYELGGETINTLGEKRLPSDSQRYHSAILLPELQSLFQAAKKQVTDLKGIATNIGPGSFTGIRTGLISARSLGQFLPIDVYAFNTFQLITFERSIQQAGKTIHIALDARRGRAYYAAGKYEQQTKDFSWTFPAGLYPIEAIQQNIQAENIQVIASESLADQLPLTQSIEVVFEKNPSNRLMAELTFSEITGGCSETFKTDWQNLLPLYLEEPNITLPKKNPTILPAG